MPDADVQIVMQGVSNLPADRFINTLHFSEAGAGSWSSLADNLIIELKTAWAPLGVYIPSTVVSRTFQIKVYNPDDAEPRQPRGSNPGNGGTTGTLVGSGAETALPTEVALCLSYYGVSNTKRNRGRIFIGPLTVAGSNTNSRPVAALQTALLDLADRLSDIGTEQVDWQIVSRVAGTRQRIQQVWVDNAFDTQRRRGLQPTARVTRAVSG
jgi:hypothetical protein